MCDRDVIRFQILKTLQKSEFPIHTHEDLIESIPEGADTIYIAEKIVMTAGAADNL